MSDDRQMQDTRCPDVTDALALCAARRRIANPRKRRVVLARIEAALLAARRPDAEAADDR